MVVLLPRRRLISVPEGPIVRHKRKINRIKTEILRRLKVLAKILDIPVIITSQLSRECEKREDKKPIIEDFSNSKNAIDKYADKILFLYRDSYYNKENKSDITDVIIAKNFDGMLDTIKVAWMSEYCMFGNTIVIEEEKDGE